MAPGWPRSTVAGQASLTGPCRVVSTALALRGPGTTTETTGAAQESRNRQRVSMGGYVGEAFEAAVVDLLIAAGGVEPDQLDENWVEEIGDGRVIESEVAVLADPRTDDIGRLGEQPVLVGQAGLHRAVCLFAPNQPQPGTFQSDQPEEVLLKIAPKRRRMIGADSQIFVHVKGDDAGPVDLLVGHEAGQELVLTRRRGQDEVGLAGHVLPVSDFPRDGLGR